MVFGVKSLQNSGALVYKGYKLSLKMVIRMTPSVIRTTWGAARHHDQYRNTGHHGTSLTSYQPNLLSQESRDGQPGFEVHIHLQKG